MELNEDKLWEMCLQCVEHLLPIWDRFMDDPTPPRTLISALRNPNTGVDLTDVRRKLSDAHHYGNGLGFQRLVSIFLVLDKYRRVEIASKEIIQDCTGVAELFTGDLAKWSNRDVKQSRYVQYIGEMSGYLSEYFWQKTLCWKMFPEVDPDEIIGGRKSFTLTCTV